MRDSNVASHEDGLKRYCVPPALRQGLGQGSFEDARLARPTIDSLLLGQGSNSIQAI